MTAPHELSIVEAGRDLRSGRLTSVALTEWALRRVSVLNPILHAFISSMESAALEAAATADKELQCGIDRGPLHGIPYAVKDIFDVKGLPTSCHSHLMTGHVAPETCTVVERLNNGGAILLGKLATHEFALGGPSFELPYPPARNPWDVERFCGGSSSGSAVAVAAGMTRMALGTDTSGSIRGPAFYCSVVGIKPTFGLVSRRGVFPLSYALDHCGALTWTVEDAACVLQVIAGHDPKDPASANCCVPDYRAALEADLKGLRIGYPRHFWTGFDGASPEIVRSLDNVAQTMAQLGARIEEVVIPDFELFSACGRIIMTAEGYAIHEQGLRERGSEYGRYTFQRLIPGAGLTAADLTQAMRIRTILTKTLNFGVMQTHHALLVAVGMSTAGRVTEFGPDWSPTMTLRTIPFTVTGNPAMAVPCGLDAAGNPLGFQLVGRPFDEATILRIGAVFQAAANYPRPRPPLACLSMPESHT